MPLHVRHRVLPHSEVIRVTEAPIPMGFGYSGFRYRWVFWFCSKPPGFTATASASTFTGHSAPSLPVENPPSTQNADGLDSFNLHARLASMKCSLTALCPVVRSA